MPVTTETPILSTRIPEGRTVAGIEYGAHVQQPGWSGYHVRTATCPQLSGDRSRYLFPDGSAIVAHGDAWDHEGNAPGTWRG